MKKNCKSKFYFCIVIFIIYIFLFSSFVKSATDPYKTEDDGTDGPEVNTLRFELTGYGGVRLGSGVSVDSLKRNEKYGWAEYEQDGRRYVALAAATHEMIKENRGRTGTYWFYGVKFDHIHYFSYMDKIQFKFEDQNFDSEVYNGIILDSGDSMMYPQHPLYHREPGINIFDVYFGRNGEGASGVNRISGKVVLASSDGTFSSAAGTSSSATTRNFSRNIFASLFILLGDVIQKHINDAGCNVNDQTSAPLIYARTDIETDEDLNNEIQVADAIAPEQEENNNLQEQQNNQNSEGGQNGFSEEQEEEIKEQYKVRKVANLSSTIDNEKGEKETIYSTDTRIPVIPMDLYTMVINQVEILDTNFYEKDSGNSSRIWNGLRNFISAFSHSVLYICAALLLTLLIWRSIMLVGSTVGGNPQGAQRSREIMDNFVKAIIIIVGVYVIMPLITYFYQLILKLVMNGNEAKYLIRVNVENVYAFNTNPIGFVKYMTLSASKLGSFLYSIIYLLMTIMNVICFIAMLARMIGIGILTILAPLTAVNGMLDTSNQKSNFSVNVLIFRNWIGWYAIFTFIPLVVVIIQRVALLII